MSEMRLVPVKTAPLELLTRFAEAIKDFAPEERQAMVRTLREMGAPRFVYHTEPTKDPA